MPHRSDKQPAVAYGGLGLNAGALRALCVPHLIKIQPSAQAAIPSQTCFARLAARAPGKLKLARMG
jgi:hypothetical protein